MQNVQLASLGRGLEEVAIVSEHNHWIRLVATPTLTTALHKYNNKPRLTQSLLKKDCSSNHMGRAPCGLRSGRW